MRPSNATRPPPINTLKINSMIFPIILTLIVSVKIEPSRRQKLRLSCGLFVGLASINPFVGAAEGAESAFDVLHQPKRQAALATPGAPTERTVQANVGQGLVNRVHVWSDKIWII